MKNATQFMNFHRAFTWKNLDVNMKLVQRMNFKPSSGKKNSISSGHPHMRTEKKSSFDPYPL